MSFMKSLVNKCRNVWVKIFYNVLMKNCNVIICNIIMIKVFWVLIVDLIIIEIIIFYVR